MNSSVYSEQVRRQNSLKIYYMRNPREPDLISFIQRQHVWVKLITASGTLKELYCNKK